MKLPVPLYASSISDVPCGCCGDNNNCGDAWGNGNGESKSKATALNDALANMHEDAISNCEGKDCPNDSEQSCTLGAISTDAPDWIDNNCTCFRHI